MRSQKPPNTSTTPRPPSPHRIPSGEQDQPHWPPPLPPASHHGFPQPTPNPKNYSCITFRLELYFPPATLEQGEPGAGADARARLRRAAACSCLLQILQNSGIEYKKKRIFKKATEKQRMTGNALGDGLISLVFICMTAIPRGPEQEQDPLQEALRGGCGSRCLEAFPKKNRFYS